MTFEDKINDLIEAALRDRTDLFLIECTISSDHHIRILLDGDQGVNLKTCIEISRSIEHNLDRETEDFSLEVASAGVGNPSKTEGSIQKYRAKTSCGTRLRTHPRRGFDGSNRNGFYP